MATIQDVVKVVNTCAHRHSDSFLVVRCDGTLFLRERSCVFFVDRIVMWLRRENSSYTKIVDVIAQKILTTDDVKEVDLCNLTAFQKEFNKYQNKKPKDEKTNEKVKDANAKLEKYVLELQKRVLKEDVRIRLNSTINNSEQQKLLSTEYDWLERGQKNESAYEVVAQLVEEHGFQSCQFDEAMKKIHYLVISRSVLYGVIPDVERQYLSLQYDWRKEGKANRDAYQSFAAYLEQNEFLKRPERGDSATRTPAIDVVGHEAHHICCLVKAQYLLSINELLISHLSNKCDWLGDGSSDKDAYEVLATYLSTSRSEREIESVITQIYNMARARYFLQARILSDLIDKLNDRYDWLGDGNSDKNAYEALATYLSTSRSESESEIESVITQIYNMARVRYLLCSNIQTSLVKKLNDRCDWLGDGSSDKNAYEAFFKYLSKPHDNDKAIIERIQNMARARNYLHRVCFTCMDELNDEYDWLGDGNSDKNAYEIIVGVTGQRLQDVKHKIENVAKARHELHIIIDDASLRSQLICKYRWVEGGEKTDAYQAFAMWQDCQGTQIRDQVKKNIVDLASARKCLLQGIGKYKKELDFLYDWFGKGKRTDAYKALVAVSYTHLTLPTNREV